MSNPKFKAWDGTKMIPQEALYWTGDKFVTGVWSNEETHIEAGDQVEVELIQYTGLDDKNGIEIYQGDIIRLTMPDEDPELESIQEVALSEGFWKVELISSSHDYDFTSLHAAVFYDEHEIEVIGNKYESPELLEAQ